MKQRKAVVLIVIMGVILVVSSLALAALYLMGHQSKVSENKIKRLRAYYAAHAGMVHVMDNLRQNNWTQGTIDLNIGTGLTGYPAGGIDPIVTITNNTTTGIATVNITVTY